MKMKTCTKCRRAYPQNAYNFYRNRSRKGGLHCWCIVCVKADRAARYAALKANRERMARRAATSAAWFKANRAKNNAVRRARYAEMTPEERRRHCQRTLEIRRASKAYRRRNQEEPTP